MLLKEPIDMAKGVSPEQLKKIANFLGFPEEVHDQVSDIISKLYNLFMSSDCTLVEINPLAEDNTGKGNFLFLQISIN